MNRVAQILSTAITLVMLVGLVLFVLTPAAIFLALYFLVSATQRHRDAVATDFHPWGRVPGS